MGGEIPDRDRARHQLRKRRCSSRTCSSRPGTGPCTVRPGATSLTASARTGDGGAPSSAQPRGQLLGGADVHDAAEPDPGVRGRAHRAVLTRGEDGGGGPVCRGHVGRGPAGQLELRVPGRVAHGVLAVAILGQDPAVRRDQHRTERDGPRRPRPRPPVRRSGAGAVGLPGRRRQDCPPRTRYVPPQLRSGSMSCDSCRFQCSATVASARHAVSGWAVSRWSPLNGSSTTVPAPSERSWPRSPAIWSMVPWPASGAAGNRGRGQAQRDPRHQRGLRPLLLRGAGRQAVAASAIQPGVNRSGCQASPSRTARRSAASLLPPIHSGICPLR